MKSNEVPPVDYRRSNIASPRNIASRRGAEQGVALVITLILLAIITFMAIAFLVISRGEKSSVTTTIDQTTAKLAADAGLERVKADILSSVMGYTNEQTYDLWVSTNYIRSLGFDANASPVSPNETNVNFDYTATGTRLTAGQQLLNLINLKHSPRVPVWMTNRTYLSNEFVFYLDLNRNGRHDPSGFMTVTNSAGLQMLDTNNLPIQGFFIGDPEWIGILERPEYPHSATNRFLARYAYIVVPAGKTLDVNYIYNYAKRVARGMNPGAGDGFLRNEGVGPWEINLAGFLHDLNTNYWMSPGNPYQYFPVKSTVNRGLAFEDALSLLRYRYNGRYQNVATISGSLGPLGFNAFRQDRIDEIPDGPMMTGAFLPPDDDTDVNWAGSDNPQHWFSMQEFYDRSKTGTAVPAASLSFSDRLQMAGTNALSYNRYTFYRLLAQLGTDSAPIGPEKMNLNYDNLVQSNTLTGVLSATNFFAWRPVDFFTNAANRMLANAGYAFTTADLQVYPTNFYTPSVHRMLQLAANLYDATTTNVNATVFRPLLGLGTNNTVIVKGYEEVKTPQQVRNLINWTRAPLDLTTSNVLQQVVSQPLSMAYGIPVVIGAKKGFPNFNNFSMQTLTKVTRKLEFKRAVNGSRFPSETNQMFTVSISNVFGIEGWNSYTNPFPRNLQMHLGLDVRAYLTNEFGKAVLLNNLANDFIAPFQPSMTVPATTWPGFSDPNHASFSFKIPLVTNWLHLPEVKFSKNSGQFLATAGINGGDFEPHPEGPFYVPHWWLNLRTRLRFVLIDTDTSQIVDFVNLDSSEDPLDITDTLMRDTADTYGACNDPYNPQGLISDGSMWCTNRGNGVYDPKIPTYGVRNQIKVGAGLNAPQDWQDFTEVLPALNRQAAINFFRTNLDTSMSAIPNTYVGPLHVTNRFFAPFSPTRNIYVSTSWQANDPLVHYTVGDLKNLLNTNRFEFKNVNSPMDNFGRQLNVRYEPWTNNLTSGSSSRTLYDLTLKDPLIGRSDDWDFPTGKYPSLGWIGRVHRGTPWQTVYLKAPGIDQLDAWQRWTGNGIVVTNFGQFTTNVVALYTNVIPTSRYFTNDAGFTQPVRDHDILDLFTTAINDNAGRGQLSINQTNLAAWSAVLSGVIALTNNVSDSALNSPSKAAQFTSWVIDPAGIYDSSVQPLPPVVRILEGITRTRGNTNATPAQAFTHLGDILNVPELTVGPTKLVASVRNPTHYEGNYPNGYWVGASPFLNLGNTNGVDAKATAAGSRLTVQQLRGLNDAAYERIPQQILGLLRLDEAPRFVIYSYGQALKPAEHSLITSGAMFGVCTNYQPTAEVATRTVVRIDGVQKNPHSVANLRAVVESFNLLPPD